jgi:hypothetical protein
MRVMYDEDLEKLKQEIKTYLDNRKLEFIESWNTQQKQVKKEDFSI